MCCVGGWESVKTPKTQSLARPRSLSPSLSQTRTYPVEPKSGDGASPGAHDLFFLLLGPVHVGGRRLRVGVHACHVVVRPGLGGPWQLLQQVQFSIGTQGGEGGTGRGCGGIVHGVWEALRRGRREGQGFSSYAKGKKRGGGVGRLGALQQRGSLGRGLDAAELPRRHHSLQPVLVEVCRWARGQKGGVFVVGRWGGTPRGVRHERRIGNRNALGLH